jgi:hypothetical protein
LKYWAPFERKSSAGTVKTTPAATDSPAEPMVCTMLFSRMVELPRRLKTAIDSTAMGTEAETVRPALNARYTVAAPKMTPKSEPRMIALGVNSGISCDAGTKGLKSSGFVADIHPPEQRCLLAEPGDASPRRRLAQGPGTGRNELMRKCLRRGAAFREEGRAGRWYNCRQVLTGLRRVPPVFAARPSAN